MTKEPSQPEGPPGQQNPQVADYAAFQLVYSATLGGGILNRIGSYQAAFLEINMCNALDGTNEYLDKYYTQKGGHQVGAMVTDDSSMARRIKGMQVFFDLQVTGKLDYSNMSIIKRPHGGVLDIANYHLSPGQPKWKKNYYSYKVVKYMSSLSHADINKAVAMGLNTWSNAAPLKSVRTNTGEADLMILFESGEHGDFFPFDGSCGVLGHVYGPGEEIGGDIHLDEEEFWTMEYVWKGSCFV
nr:LOW QUALITY PROTEIN: matrix metalloproteinase-20-like [Caretta caretta]